MPIESFPFFRAHQGDSKDRPWLIIQIENPHAGRSLPTIGLIDTGADECCLPASHADFLGHNLLAGTPKVINTGNGPTTAYSHTCTIKIFDSKLLFEHNRLQVVHTIDETLIDFMEHLHCVLLGLKTFLSDFILTVDYPRHVFSIRKP